MRVGINLLYLIPGVVGGTQTYAVGLLDGLRQLDTEDEFILYLNRECANLELPHGANFRRVICPINAVSRGRRYAWEQFALPLQARRDRLDVLHSLGYVGPVRTSCPHVLSIHDMNYLDIPASVEGIRQRTLRTLVKRAARNADRVLTISEFSRGRIMHHLGLPSDSVTVTYLASRDDAGTQPDNPSIIKARYGITQPYIAAFSSPFPHKNILRLIDAFALLAHTHPHSLVLIGHLTPGGEIPAAISSANLADRVVITGYVPDVDIMPLLAAADVFAFPSLYEGFGLPILDAQRCRVPVVASRSASVPEVAGEGAEYFDADDTEGMAAAIKKVIRDTGHAAALRQRGLANLARFSWRKTAAETLTVYRSVGNAQA